MIIGISGKINSGKDATARIIQELTLERGYYVGNKFLTRPWQIKKFAAKLKKRIAITWGVHSSKFEDQDFKKQLSPLGITWRELLQKEGEKMREIDEDYWVKAAMSDYRLCSVCSWTGESNPTGFSCQGCEPVEEPNWLITDMRYPNELRAVKDRGGITLRINRPTWYEEQERQSFLEFVNNLEPHHSETSLDDATFDYTINNDGSLSDLTTKVKVFLTEFKII